MASPLFQPLNILVPIVDPKTGTPTPQFQRLLQDLGLAAGLTVQGGQISIVDNGVSFAKLQDIPSQRVIGRNTAGPGDPEEVTISQILDWISNVRGTVLYRGPAGWAALAPGTAGHFLKTNGAGADPAWAAAGGGAMALISEVVTTGSAANVQFASIPSTYRDLKLVIRGRGTVSATSAAIRIRFNADTGANYDLEIHSFTNTGVSGGGFSGETSGFLGDIPAATATSGISGLIEALIGDYRGTTFQKAVLADAARRTGTSAGTLTRQNNATWWRSAAAIAQIDVFPASNGFVDGTIVSLYGVM